jgi:hypothetical protein
MIAPYSGFGVICQRELANSSLSITTKAALGSVNRPRGRQAAHLIAGRSQGLASGDPCPASKGFLGCFQFRPDRVTGQAISRAQHEDDTQRRRFEMQPVYGLAWPVGDHLLGVVGEVG